MEDRYGALDDNNKLIWNFRDIWHTMHHMYEGRGSQRRVLMILRDAPTITQRELTERLGIQPGSASELIGKLEAAGFLRRAPSEEDRRTSDILLTEAGQAAAEEAYAQREARHRQMFSCLSEAEKETLLGLLEKLNGAWEQQYGRGEKQGPNHRKGHGHHGPRGHKE